MVSLFRNVFQSDIRRAKVSFLDLVEHFFTVDRDVFGRFDPDTDLLATNFKNDDFNPIADHDALMQFARQHQHLRLPSLAG
jgi:hypothetical protein